VLRRKEAFGDEVVDLEIRWAKGELRVNRPPAVHDAGAVGGGSFAPALPPPALRMTGELERRLTRMFQLHVDLGGFHSLTRNSPAHAWVAPAGFGRLLCGATLWEDAVKIIATTNTMWSQTVRMVEMLVAKCGRDGAFPSQEDILRFSADELQRDCRLGYRAKSIHALASVDLELPNDGTTEERFKRFLELPGIGPYGAAHLLAMDGRHDFIAVDTEFRRFVRETYHGGRKVSDATMLRRYAKWGQWKYLAYWSELWGSR
jgi:3-methyladenine DNA glycosylase/8-oxoguanine DNA glycosylase